MTLEMMIRRSMMDSVVMIRMVGTIVVMMWMMIMEIY